MSWYRITGTRLVWRTGDKLPYIVRGNRHKVCKDGSCTGAEFLVVAITSSCIVAGQFCANVSYLFSKEPTKVIGKGDGISMRRINNITGTPQEQVCSFEKPSLIRAETAMVNSSSVFNRACCSCCSDFRANEYIYVIDRVRGPYWENIGPRS